MRAIILALGLSLLAAPVLAQDAQSTAPPPAGDQAAPPANPPPNPTMTGPQLLISTSMGDITLQLDSVRAPKSVANVLRYVREKHYDGTAMYRVVKGFVIQMGSFDAKGQGRGVYPGSVPLEANNGLHNLRGAAALAHGDDPDSATADFFIDVDDNPSLDQNDTSPGYAVFGQVSGGMDVVNQISQVPVGDNGPMKGQAPVDPILIKKVSIVGEPDAPPKPAPKKKK
jgi:cyclophilin family peptidyl-prolyl cis-trans isomerase